MQQASTDVAPAALGDYGAALLRRWCVVLAGLLIGLAAGFGLTALQPKQYTAETSVLVLAAGTGPNTSLSSGRAAPAVNLDTEAELVTSADVAAAARTALGAAAPVTDLLPRVSVSVPVNSQVLVISYVGADPQSAQRGSQAFAEAYLAQRGKTAETETAATVSKLRSRLDTLGGQLREATDKVATLPTNSPDRALAEEQRSLIVAEVTNINNMLVGLESTPITPGQIITDAELPSGPSAPSLALNLAAGLFAGLLVGLVLAVALDRADHRVRRGGDVERKVGLPLLADLSGPADSGMPATELDDAVDRLRLGLLAEDHERRIFQVSDPGRGIAGSRASVQLARSLRHAFDDVVLVVAASGSRVPVWTGTTSAPGLVELLRREVELADVLVEVPELPGVRVVPPGRDPEALRSLLQSAALPELVRSLRSGSWQRPVGAEALVPVVVETEGTGDSAGAAAVAATSDVVLLTADRASADARTLEEAAAGATAVGARVAGVVLTGGRARRRRRRWRRRRAHRERTLHRAVGPIPAATTSSSRRPRLVDSGRADEPEVVPAREAASPR